MFEETGSLVECSVCETEFDPTAAGGWCTNPDCGEWRYDGEDVPAPGTETDEPDAGDPVAEPERDASEYNAAEIAGEPATEEFATADAAAEESTDGERPDSESVNDTADTDADSVESTGTATDEDESPEVEEEASAVEEDEPSAVEEDEPSETEDDQPEEITCPGCEDTLDADVDFCPSCGEDVSGADQTSEVELTECPACGDSVDAEDRFCASCGENLEEHRGSSLLTACHDCGATVGEDDSFCAECGADLDAHRESTGSAATDAAESDSLVLETRDREITVSDGEIVGRELRKIITETGGDENDAVRIHREHIRFVREDGQFYLVDLGENPTAVNGQPLEKGDREPVSAGDTVTLSDVVTLSVTAP